MFQYGHDDDQMVAIQHLLAVCNQDLFQPLEWFRWRYEQNPLGKAIIVCAQENERILACLVVEKLHVICGSEVCRCGCVTGVAIKEESEREDILPRLLAVAGNEAKDQGLDIIFAFDSVSDQLRDAESEWAIDSVETSQVIQPMRPFRSIFRLSDVNKAFVPNKCTAYHPVGIDTICFDELANSFAGTGGWTMEPDMFKWIVSFTDKEYALIDNNDVTAIAAVGRRGIQKDAHLLMMISKKEGVPAGRYLRDVLEVVREKINPDEVSAVESEQLLFGDGLLMSKTRVNYAYQLLKGGNGNVREIAMAIHGWL